MEIFIVIFVAIFVVLVITYNLCTDETGLCILSIPGKWISSYKIGVEKKEEEEEPEHDCGVHGNWNGTECICESGFSGSDCKVVVHQCLNGCGENGECDELSGTCICSDNWIGEDCSEPVVPTETTETETETTETFNYRRRRY